VKVHLSSPQAMRPLLDALVEAQCRVYRVDETTCVVGLAERTNRAQATLELRFFVAAWARTLPGLSATVTA
jgi:hypothetical protein